MAWSRNGSWLEVIAAVSVRQSAILHPGKNTGKIWRDARYTETEVLTALRGCSMRMMSDVNSRVDGSGTIGGHNVALVLF